jgi:hypothetical protein
MPSLLLKPTHRVVQEFYGCLGQFDNRGVRHEGAVRSAFQTLLDTCARQFDWKLVPEYRTKAKAGNQVQVDGDLLDNYGLVRGYREAKDGADDLDKEIKDKFAAGCPRDNIEPRRAVSRANAALWMINE